MTSCFVLEQLTQAGWSLLAAQCVFPSDTCIAGEWHDVSVPDSPSHPPQSALAGLGLAGTPTAPWRSCESTNTHAETKHSPGNKNTLTHTHMIPQSRDLCIPNYSSDMETLQSRKHLPFLLSYMSTLMPFLKRGKEREPI